MISGIALVLAARFVAAAASLPAKPSLIPTPRSIIWLANDFVLDAHTRIVIPRDASGEVRWAADALQRALAETVNLRVSVTAGDTAKPPKGGLVLRPGLRDALLGDEGYSLRVEQGRAVLEASGGRGMFYGVQTLRQLVNRGPRTAIAGCRVRDWPAWPYRGVLHDPARNFMTLDFLRKQIDILSSYKLNQFHLHLTDDQGWRVEIKSHPVLASQQCYRQQELKELVAYAKARFVTIVPEIEMPGHAGAFAQSMPDLAHGNAMCIGNERTYEVLRDVWKEMAAIFDGPYLHIGGDETSENLDCPRCRGKAEELRKSGAQSGGLVPYFLARVNEIIKSLGRQMIAWTVAPEGGRYWDGVLPKDVTVMAWKSSAVEYVRKGYRTINTTTKPIYFTDLHPIADILSWTPNEGDPGPLPGLLGAEAEAWPQRGDYGLPPNQILAKIGYYARLLAYSERVWGAAGEAPPTGLGEFENRLLKHRERYLQGEPFPYPPPTKAPAKPSKP